MQARWAWAVGAAIVAGAVAVGVVAAIDDGPQPADAQETTTTTAPGGGGTAGTSDSNPLRTVTVTADGTASGTPDTAIVQLGVRTRAESANEALDLANQKATDLLAALDFGGVEKEDITTTNVFVYPQYGNDGRDITGYEAGNTVSVKIRDIENAGTIIDATAGVVGDEIVLEGVSFTIDDTGALREAAREDALTNAKAQAEQLASASGLSLGDIVSIVEGSVPQIPIFRAEATAADAAGGSVPLEPGQQELNLAVTVVYELTS
jgi:uncharacterized protein YggE